MTHLHFIVEVFPFAFTYLNAITWWLKNTFIENTGSLLFFLCSRKDWKINFFNIKDSRRAQLFLKPFERTGSNKMKTSVCIIPVFAGIPVDWSAAAEPRVRVLRARPHHPPAQALHGPRPPPQPCLPHLESLLLRGQQLLLDPPVRRDQW